MEGPSTNKSLAGTSVPSARRLTRTAGCALSHVPLSHLGARPVPGLAGRLPQVRTRGFVTQVSVLTKICFAAKKLACNLTAPLPRRAVAVRRVPSPFRLPSPYCTSPSPPGCLPEAALSPGTCRASPLEWLWSAQTAKPVQTESIWLHFVCVETTARPSVPSTEVVTDFSEEGEHVQTCMDIHACACLKALVPANPLLT